MSKQFDKTNTGVLFKNDLEGKSENFPPYGGSLNVDGQEYWVSAWVKDGQNGKFFSLAIKPKEAKQDRVTASKPKPTEDFVDDSIPF